MTVITHCEEIAPRIPPYVENTLPSGERGAMDAHLRHCPACRTALKRFAQLQAFARTTLGPGVLPPEFGAETGQRMTHITTGSLPVMKAGEDLAEAPARPWFDRIQERLGAAPWWMISGAFHALLLLMLTLIGMALLRSGEKEVVIVTNLEKRPEPEEVKQQLPRDVFKNPVPVEMTEVTPEPTVVTHEEVEVAEHVETANETDANEARGTNGLTDVDLGGSGTAAALGMGGGGGGAYGRPTGAGGRLRRAVAGGGGQATESAVDKALEWLARNQEADGHWDLAKHECAENPPPDVGGTGLALLAFLGAGHTEKVGKYKDNVRRAQEWLMAQQQANGVIYSKFRGNGYCHAVAGLALAEAAAMGRNPKVKEAAQKAVNYSVNIHQSGADKGSDRSGWRYTKGSSPDTSVTGWFVMQLKSARIAGLQVDPAGFQGAENWLNQVEVQKPKPNDPYSGGTFGYTSNANDYESITSVGMLSRLFLGAKPDGLRGGEALLLKNLPEYKETSAHQHPFYYWYYGTLAMFQMGGDGWKTWNEAMKKTLLDHQVKGGKEDGSWDPLGREGLRGGRVVCTALGVLSLEVYYRYLPLYR